jgi:hypothetical protein
MSKRASFAAFVIALFGAFPARSAPAPKETNAKPPEPEIMAQAAEATEDEAARYRSVSEGHLKQLTLAIINCADSQQGKLPRNLTDKKGKPQLSWRVHILPYIEENDLYKAFKLDEPWDSENNLKLLEQMPKIFASPRVTVKRKGYTVYQGFAGEGTVFEPGQELRYPASIPDGTSNTIMLVESSIAVPWTKPADVPFDAKKDLPDFGKAFGAKPLVAMCDGSVRRLDLKNLSEKTLKNAITRADGFPLGADW